MYYDLTLAYKNELYLFDFLLIQILRKYKEKKPYIHFCVFCVAL